MYQLSHVLVRYIAIADMGIICPVKLKKQRLHLYPLMTAIPLKSLPINAERNALEYNWYMLKHTNKL